MPQPRRRRSSRHLPADDNIPLSPPPPTASVEDHVNTRPTRNRRQTHFFAPDINPTFRRRPAPPTNPQQDPPLLHNDNPFQALEDTMEEQEDHAPLPTKDTWVVYTDGSFTRGATKSSSTAGWGAVVVKNGGLPGPTENEGEVVTELYGRVIINQSKNFLENVGGVKSNNTAELSGIGEAILYLLQELRSPNPPSLSRIMLRPDSEYARKCAMGEDTSRENTQMAAEIRRHHDDLKSSCQTKNITFEWNHVAAHDNRRWNCRADDLAKEYAPAKKNGANRATARNAREHVHDRQRLYPDEHHVPPCLSNFTITPDNDPVLNAEDTPENANILDWYANTPIHRIPAEHVGILCDLLPTKVHVRKRNMQKVRTCFNLVFGELRKENNTRDSVWWRKALLLPRVLFTPTTPGLDLNFNSRCNLVLSNNWTRFTFDSFIRRKHAAPGLKEVPEFDKARVKRSKIYMQAGEISRAYKALQSENLPIPSIEQVFQKLNDLHPERPATSEMPVLPEDLPHLTLSADEVEKTIQQTKKCVTNCPITALRYELLKQLVGQNLEQDEQSFLQTFTWFINQIANGLAPPDIAEILTSTLAIALAKKDNGIRPIGLRDGFVNLTTKCIVKHLQDKTVKIFEGKNYALAGPKKMDELIAMTAHAFRITPENDRLFLDQINAFNKCDRGKAAMEIQARLSELTRYYYFLYQENTNIWTRDGENSWNTITSAQGGIQGCVLAPIVFGFSSLGLYEIVANMLEDKDNSFFGAYLDDSIVSAAHEDTVQALRVFQEEGAKYGMELNYGPNKTVVLMGICDNEDVENRIATYRELGIPRENIKVHPENGGDPQEYGYTHLGIPVGHKDYQYQQLHSLVNKFIRSGECDAVVEEAQEKWVYLMWVIRQKFPFWFRHMCPSITSTVEGKIETHMKKKFEAVLGQTVSQREWEQACLPTKSHGCGLGRPPDTISAAFAANIEETLSSVKEKLPATTGYMDLIHATPDTFHTYEFESVETRTFVRTAREKKQEVIDAATALREIPVLTKYDADDNKKKKRAQNVYADFINRARAKHFEEVTRDNGSEEHRARFLSTKGSFAGAWLHNIPKDSHSTMSSPEFRTALMLRLGSHFHTLHSHCCCRPQPRATTRVFVGTSPTHYFCCNEMKPYLLIRHDAIQNEFLKLAYHGKVSVTNAGLGRLNEDDGRKGDLLFSYLGPNKSPLMVDFCIATACAISYLRNACTIEGYAMSRLEKIKFDKYLELYRRQGINFKPIALETHGATSKLFQELFEKLVTAAARRSHIPYCILYSYWQKRMSTVLQKSNAKVLQLAEQKVAQEFGLTAGIAGGDARLLNDHVLQDNHNYNLPGFDVVP